MNLFVLLFSLLLPFDELKDAEDALKVSYVDLLDNASNRGVVSWYGGAALTGVNAYKSALNECEMLGYVETDYASAFASWFSHFNAMTVLLGPSDLPLTLKHFNDGAVFVGLYEDALESCLDGGPLDPPDWILSPNAILETSTGFVTATDNPIQDCIGADQWSSSGKNRDSMFTRGDVIELGQGDYHHFRITLSTDMIPGVEKVTDPSHVDWGRDPQTIIRAPQGATILNNPVGGSQTLYLEWGGAFSFEGLTFTGDDLMGVGSERPSSARFDYHQGFRDFEFINCSIAGGWNAESWVEEPKNKWGVLNYEMGQSARGVPGWIWKGGEIWGIWDEHGNYFHNTIGDVLIEDLKIKWCGRTAFQFANRIEEGPAGVGDWTFRDVDVEDVCLQDGGGGSAFSFNGRHEGTIFLERVKVYLGANPNLAAPRNKNITGALVVHAGEDTNDLPNGHVIVSDCDFQVGPHFVGEGAARRGNIQVRECDSFTLINTRVAQLGDNPREALDISPNLVVGEIILDASNEIIGECIWDGDKFPDYQTMLGEIAGEPGVTIR